jgi:hypothetical protein
LAIVGVREGYCGTVTNPIVIVPGTSGGGTGFIAESPSSITTEPEVVREILSFLGR